MKDEAVRRSAAGGSISFAESQAFVDIFELIPTASGPLDGLRFAVKDLIDIAGHKTACGNPTWRDTHPPAVVNAVCVDQLLAAGGHRAGKTITDELAFSLVGENFFYGTPLNPRAPDRVPGGSSSGSASAVACGLVDFALGTDTGGSVRVPASNCGIWGLRSSHGLISVAGVNPFAPTFDTVGVLATSADVLTRAACVLLACDATPGQPVGKIHFIPEAFDLVDVEVQAAMKSSRDLIQHGFPHRCCETRLSEITTGLALNEFPAMYDTYNILQWAEIESTLGAWVAEAEPKFGPVITANFELVKNLDRRQIAAAVERRETFCRRLNSFLGPDDLLCIPTTPALAPLKGTMPHRDGNDAKYYSRALALTAIAGLARLPQVSLPLAEVNGVPIGISLVAAHGCDGFLLSAIQAVASSAR